MNTTNQCKTTGACASPVTTSNGSTSARTLVPRCDVLERDGAILVVLEMPGVPQSGVDVGLERGVLTVRGKPDTNVPEGMQLVWREFEDGEYRRSFQLNDDVDVEAIGATMTNGLLTLRIPRKRPASRRIPVQVG